MYVVFLLKLFAFGVILRNPLQNPRSQSLTPVFSWGVSQFLLLRPFRSSILLSWVVFLNIWCEVGVQLHSLVQGDPVVPAPFVEEIMLSSLNSLGTLVKNELTVDTWVYLWNLSPIPLIYMTVFMLPCFLKHAIQNTL